MWAWLSYSLLEQMSIQMFYLSRLPSRRDKEKHRCNVDEYDKRSGWKQTD